MPKIIENIRENLMAEARKQVMELGYSAMTIRSVAKACGVGVGTVYNYFPSKDMLVASFMLTDWQQCMSRLQDCCKQSDEPGKVLQCIYDELKSFMEQYVTLFQDKSAGVIFAAALPERHGQLRCQIAEPLLELCKKQNRAEPEFLAEFVAESMLTWTMAGKEFDEIYIVLQKLFKE